jgi:hypothetical protein
LTIPVIADQVATADAGQILAAAGGVPLVTGANGPAIVDGVIGVGDPGRSAILHRDLVADDGARLVEVEDLADAGRQLLAAIGLADHPRGQCQRHLVGVGLPVRTGVAVVAEQLPPAEGQRTGVEQGHIPLVLIWSMQVEQPRLQGMQEGLAAEFGLPVEEQAGVDRRDRDAAGRRRVGGCGAIVVGNDLS